MKKFLLKISLFTSLLVLPLYALRNQYDRQMTNVLTEKAQWVLKQQNGNFDIAFLGSSRVYNCLDNQLIDSVLNVRSINLGVGGASYAEQYLLLYSFLKKNSVRKVFVQVDLWGLVAAERAYNHSFSEEKYLHLLGDPVVDSIYYENTNKLKYYPRKYGLFFKYAEFNNIYPLNVMLLSDVKLNLRNIVDNESGSFISDKKKAGFRFSNLRAGNLSDLSISDSSVSSLKEIVKLAHDKRLEVVFYTAPSYVKFMNCLPLYARAQEKINDLAEELKVDYINFETDSICLDSAFFRDFSHLNRSGTHQFSLKLADTQKKKYE